MTEDRVWATAIHEAGHAVIGRVLGYPCGKTTIEPGDGYLGYSVSSKPEKAVDAWRRAGKSHRTTRTALRARIMVEMAGRDAEEECLGFCAVAHSDSDQFRVAGMIVDLIGVGDVTHLLRGERFQQRMRKATRWLVHRHRRKIEALASALIKHRVMTDSQIRSVIG